MMKKHLALRILTGFIALLLLVIIGYVIYVFGTYSRIADHQRLEPDHAENLSAVQTGVEYTAVTWNLGFGAYTPDFSFFMDGGKQSRARSRESVIDCTEGPAARVMTMSPDFIFFEEVDRNSTRSHHVDQFEILRQNLPGMDNVFAVNYDSAYLFYPFTEPHGKSLSGLATFSHFPITGAERRSLPISTSVSKIVDLDRCYTVSRVPVENGHELVLYTVHLTAYSSDPKIREGQLAMLMEDMRGELAKGCYILCGGDFNCEMLETQVPADQPAWALPFDRSILGDDFTLVWDILTEPEKAAQPRSCRDTGDIYRPGTTPCYMLDGFIISNNIRAKSICCETTGFTWSDHDPVKMTFELLEGE